MIHFYDLARNAVENTAESENKVTWNVIREACGPLMHSLSSMKFKGKRSSQVQVANFDSDPVADGEADIKAHFEKLNEDLSTKFNSLIDI